MATSTTSTRCYSPSVRAQLQELRRVSSSFNATVLYLNRPRPVAERTFIVERVSRIVGVNFGGHFGGQNVQVSMGQNGWSRVVYNRLNKSIRKS